MYPTLVNRPTWIELDTQQFEKNLIYINEQAQGQEVWAVVKSDAYNHGIEQLFPYFVKNKITNFCVGQYDEACQLQAIADYHKVPIRILIFGVIYYEKLEILPENWSITIADLATARKTVEMLEKVTTQNKLHVQVKIDSGMNRRGVKTALELAQLLDILESSKKIALFGAYTHFSTADSDIVFMQKQVERFQTILGEKKHCFHYLHAQNSYGLLNVTAKEKQFFHLIRPGGICYGMTGTEHPVCKPIFNLYTKIIEKKQVRKGETIGYGNTYTCKNNGYLAVIPIGYADGWHKSNTELTVYVNNIPCKIVGKICMEQCMIFSEKDIFEIGDTVELVGEHNSIYTVATHNKIDDYEFICSFLSRIPRKYKERGEE